MNPELPPGTRCGIDTVEIARMEKLLQAHTPESLAQLFSATELADAGTGKGRAESLAARFAAKEACCKLFPKETALGTIQPTDFSVKRDGYGAPQIEVNANAETVLGRHRIAKLRVSLTHTNASASAIAWAEPQPMRVPWIGKLVYYVLPLRRRVVLGNLRRVFADSISELEIRRLAQAYYAHYASFISDFLRQLFMSAERRKTWIRVENIDSPLRVHNEGKGILLLTGHFGNWEVSTVAGIQQFPEYKNLFYFVRRPLRPKWFNDFITWRFKKAGLGTLSKRGSLDQIMDLLVNGAIIVNVFDQHAHEREGVTVDFLGHPASTFKSLALLAMETGAPVIPSYSWREPDGTHVLRFEEPLPLIECEDVGEAIRRNTRAYNAALERMLLRHPEQWIWMHKRWKVKV